MVPNRSDRVQSLASIFGNAVARKRATEDVERALRFERLVGRYVGFASQGAIGRSGEAAGRSLQAIGESLHVESGRAVVAERRVGSPGAGVQLACRKRRSRCRSSWANRASMDVRQAASRRHVSFSCSEKTAVEASIDEQTLARRGVRSLLLVPVMVEGAVSGALSLAAVELVRSWPEDLLPRMRLLGEMFAVMLAPRARVAAPARSPSRSGSVPRAPRASGAGAHRRRDVHVDRARDQSAAGGD